MGFKTVKGRIVFWAGLCIVLSLAVVIAVSTWASRTAAFNDAVKVIQAEAAEQALNIGVRIDTNLTLVRGLAQGVRGWKEEPSTFDRKTLTSMMGVIARENTDIFGVWTVWEPEAFDGNDAASKGTPYSDIDGQMTAYWNKANGLHLSSTSGHDDVSSNGWYTEARDSRNEVVYAPTPYEIDGRPMVLASLVVPIVVNGRSLGVMGADIDVKFLQEMADKVHMYGGQGKIIIVDDSGKIAGMTGKSEFNGKPISEVMPGIERQVKDFAANREFYEDKDGLIRIGVPISFGSAKARWGVIVTLPEAVIAGPVNAQALKLVGLGAACLIFAMAMLWFMAELIAKPIRNTSEAVGKIADGDLDVHLEAKGVDESANMQRAVNRMAEKLRENISEIETQMKLAEEKSMQAEEAKAAAEEARKEAVKAKSEGLLSAAESLGGVVTQIDELASELAAGAQELTAGVDTQRRRITETATAMEEMNATVLEVARNSAGASKESSNTRSKAESGVVVVDEGRTTMHQVREMATGLSERMGRLGERAQDIGSVMNVITDIADQTNLLALNAAIEAARAGEAGRGFAVVADEVRKLAEKTMDATKEVGQSIAAIQQVAQENIKDVEKTTGTVDVAVAKIDESGTMLNEIFDAADLASQMIQEIATAAEEQSATFTEINNSVEEVDSIAERTTENIHNAVEAIKKLSEESALLSELVDKLREEAAQ
ncbi:methyl-accepting chemotaxis protein [Maridesulfovibrio hydrothermalis]|uniref:Putative HAMP domain protein n=1 Tax=Maridesulfovibrio hydrothermalis AM13 = DSM 14728 TaxID=1121451 RepID=L0R9T4_9BACT|nr:methyl-accepting chemotaxis protein [Maridesulfovibrio hydrothermalis]CCO22972.1 putative HAMP domain protein [Maridesulfovibrio hydrothermalis AM13 = DSM 14728]